MIQNILNYLFSYESILIISVVIISIINIIVNHKISNRVLIINFILLLIYFAISKRNDKIVLLLTIIHFALWGSLIEYIIINKTTTLQYTNISKNSLIPSWLISVYAIFALSSIYTYDLMKVIIKFI
jgi:hypothetical protein